MEIPYETVGTGLLGAGVAAAFVRKLLRTWFSDKKEVVKEAAETSLYQNLLAENTRMAESMKKLSLQIEVLIQDNVTLQGKLASLERKLQASHDWEQTCKELQEDLRQRDVIIAQLARNQTAKD